MGIEFGKNARKIVERGDMACSFQYVNEQESACFYPLLRRGNGSAANKPFCYVIALDAAWKYADDRYCMKQAAIAARLMGFEVTRKQCVKIASFFQDMLIELLTMKPMPYSMYPKMDLHNVSIEGNKIKIEAGA